MIICKIIKNSPEISQEYNKSSNKFTTTSKHFKTLVNETHNFKKKLIFSPNVSVVLPQISKNDSERLFVDSNRKTVPLDSILNVENSDSYLDQQLSTNESRDSPVAESPCSHRKRAKRKLSKNYFSDVATDKRCPKTRKISIKPEVITSSDGHSCSPLRSTKKDVSDENSFSSSPSLLSTTTALSKNAEGTFIGFIDSEISESYYRFQTAIKCFVFLKSMEKEDFSNMTTVSPSLPFFNCVDVLCPTGCADSSENKAREYNCEKECTKSIENSVDRIEMQMQMQKSLESDSSSRIETDIIDDKQEFAHVQQEVSKNSNSVLSLPDPEMEEAMDINLWQHDEKVSRKKKALMFKSVKERNRRRILFDGSVKLHSAADNVNVVQLEAPVPLKQLEASNDSQIDDLKQSLPEKMSVQKKGDIKITSELNTYCRVPDSKQESDSTKIMSRLNEKSSYNWVTETNDESSLVGKSSVSQTWPSKPCVNFLKVRSEEDNIQVSRMPIPKIEPNITTNSCPVPSTTKSMVEIFPPKFANNSKLKVGPGLLSKSRSYSSISTEASLKTAEIIPSTEKNGNTNFKSFPVDIVCTKSIASIGLMPADDYKIHTGHAFPSNFPQSPVTTYESSSCSVELIEKYSQETVATISDTVTNGDQNHVTEIVTFIPSQPITVFSSSSKDNISTTIKTDQTAGDIKSDGTVEVDIASSGIFKSENLSVSCTQTKEKCTQIKKAISDQNKQSFDNICSSFIFPKAPSVELFEGQNISSSKVNFVDSFLEKIEFGNNHINFPEKLTESPKKFILDAISR